MYWKASALSTKRKLTGADAVPSKKAPHGGFQCRWCSQEVFPPKRTFCSEACSHSWQLRSDIAYLRSQVFLRDKGICQTCRLDTLALRARMYGMTLEEREEAGRLHRIDAYHARKLMLWEADHIVPVFKGGGIDRSVSDKDYLANLQTLCTRCHQRKTKTDMKR